MPQDSALYGVARIRCHEKGLISRDRMQRFVDMSAQEVLRQLLDAGYGAMPDATLGDVEALIASELARAYELVREVTCDPAVTDLFLMAADVHNLKLLLKLRLTQSREEPAYMAGGVYPPAELKRMVQDRDYESLPQPLGNALTSLEEGFAQTVDPVKVSVMLDDAYLQLARSSKSPFVREYFGAMADFNNALALLRLQAMKAGPEELKDVLLHGGAVPQEAFLSAMEAEPETLPKLLAQGPAGESLARGIAQAVQTGRISALERERDNYLMALARRGKNDIDTIAPIVGYLLAREQEARCLRLILTLKRNGVGAEVIEERLREVYG